MDEVTRALDPVALLAEVERLRTDRDRLLDVLREQTTALEDLYFRWPGQTSPDLDQAAYAINHGKQAMLALRGGGGENIEQ